MPRASNLRTRELQWHQSHVEARRVTAFRHIPIRDGVSLHNLYLQLQKHRAARERQARLVCCGLLPSVLALVLHLNW